MCIDVHMPEAADAGGGCVFSLVCSTQMFWYCIRGHQGDSIQRNFNENKISSLNFVSSAGHNSQKHLLRLCAQLSGNPRHNEVDGCGQIVVPLCSHEWQSERCERWNKERWNKVDPHKPCSGSGRIPSPGSNVQNPGYLRPQIYFCWIRPETLAQYCFPTETKQNPMETSQTEHKSGNPPLLFPVPGFQKGTAPDHGGKLPIDYCSQELL